jgi:hypothetical protein
MMKRNALWALLAVGMTVVSTGVVNAQWLLPKVGFLEEFRKKSIVGSWVESVTFYNGRPNLESLVSFHADGTLMASDQGSVVLPPDPHAGVSSSGVGAWTQLDWHTFAYTNKELFSDFSGNLTGFLKVSGIYTLDHSGDTYNGYSFFQVYDTSDPPVLQDSGFVTNKGERISVEMPPAQP